jgi:flagellar biosynthesis/type III secretory pathway protein FliH
MTGCESETDEAEANGYAEGYAEGYTDGNAGGYDSECRDEEMMRGW